MNYVTMQLLGNHGRLGNQIFQVAFLYCYSRLYNLVAQAPKPREWPFEFPFGPITVNLVPLAERWKNQHGESFPPSGTEFINRDFRGYAQWPTAWYVPWKTDLQQLFALPRPVSDGRIRIGVHHRAGDYDNKTSKWRAPRQWYRDWMDMNLGRFENPVVVVAAEDKSCMPTFDLPTEQVKVLYGTAAEDWAELNRCDVVLMPNATFSFTAAMMNPHLKESWRASLPHAGFVQFDTWNAIPLLYDLCEGYRHLLDNI